MGQPLGLTGPELGLRHTRPKVSAPLAKADPKAENEESLIAPTGLQGSQQRTHPGEPEHPILSPACPGAVSPRVDGGRTRPMQAHGGSRLKLTWPRDTPGEVQGCTEPDANWRATSVSARMAPCTPSAEVCGFMHLLLPLHLETALSGSWFPICRLQVEPTAAGQGTGLVRGQCGWPVGQWWHQTLWEKEMAGRISKQQLVRGCWGREGWFPTAGAGKSETRTKMLWWGLDPSAP